MTKHDLPRAPSVNHTSHWGAFVGRVEGDRLRIDPSPRDSDPSPLLQNIATGARHKARIARPMARRGWLEEGPGPTARRGRDEFVAVEWDEILDRLGDELKRVLAQHGAEAIYGGSYGWASAGRFHHAQSQIHRFLNAIGGYVRSVNSYSAGAATVIIPHVIGPFDEIYLNAVRWSEVEQHADLVVAFGGMAVKNAMISGGGISRHEVHGHLRNARKRGTRFVLFSPLRDDLPEDVEAEWQPIRPGTDTALMLGLAHTLISAGLHDLPFLERNCEGFAPLSAYIMGETDGQPKDAHWAAAITGIGADVIVDLAHRMAAGRTLISVSQSIQRAEHGEQPVWMAVALAAILGQIGLPGGGFAYGLGSMADTGKGNVAIRLPSLPQGRNRVSAYIPVARIADMLLNPGEPFDYNGQRLEYPRIRLVYWAGGNPFHHHQDLTRLAEAFGRPDTIVVHDSAWTATARHADVVLPATMSVERNDIGASRNDPFLIAMHQLLPPFAEAKDDYDIFSGLAARLGVAETFTEGRSAMEWLRHLYDETRARIAEAGSEAPGFQEFWERGEIALPLADYDGGSLRKFRADPERHPLRTPSGKVELFSKAIAGFGYADCPGHPTWLPPVEDVGSATAENYPLQLISNQPATRLHSQLDFGSTSAASKREGREPLRINPADAAARSIAASDVVRVFNERGAFLAAAVLSDDVRPGVLQIATGAWYDPVVQPDGSILCVHGNPNAVTRDAGTSSLAQGCTGQLTLVDIARYDDDLPSITAYDPPAQ